MKSQAYKLTLLFLGVSAICQISGLGARAATLPIKSYTTSDGLAHDRVNRIVRDSRGFLWFCTSEGLSRFDGFEFKNYTQDDGLPHRAIMDLIETRGGEYWIATNDGLVFFDPLGFSTRGQTDGNDGRRPMFRTLRPEGLTKGSATWAVYDLLEDREGQIWAASSHGLFRVARQTGDRLDRFDIPAAAEKKVEDFSNLLQDRTGAIWAGALSGLYRILPETLGVQTINKDIRVESLLETSDGQVWVGSAGGDRTMVGIHVFSYVDGEPRPTRVFRKSDGLTDHSWINSLLETNDGRIFVGIGNGLCEYTPNVGPEEPKFRVVSNESIVELGEDPRGDIWFSTNSTGVRRLARHGFIAYDKSDGLAGEAIRSIISAANGESYFLSESFKIDRFDGTRFHSVSPRSVIEKNWGTGQISFPDRSGAWWIAGASGLQRYPSVKRLEDLESVEPLKTYTTSDGLFSNGVFQLFEDSRGDIWISVIGTDNSLMRWDRATDRIHGYTAEDNLPSKNGAVTLGEDRAGNIWLGFYYGGLYRFRNGRFEAFTVEDGLPPGMIRHIFTDSAGRLWVATSSGGVIKINDPTTEEKPRLESLTTRDGLSSNQATCTTEDEFGRIYIATGRGVNRLDQLAGKVKVFTKADGLPENIVLQCKRDSHGAMWFGTFNGIARYVPIADEQSKPPPVFLSNLRINGESIKKLSELGEVTAGDLDLGSDQRQIQVDFFALGFGTGESLRYQYMLDGEWSSPAAERTVNLNLSAGKYQFAVRAVNADGISSETPASFSFTIARPVWQRWWFLLILSALTGGMVYVLYRYRLKRLVELEKVRTRIATDLHDDIGSSLSQIAILSEVVRQKVGDNGVSQPLVMIADTSREMVDSMSDIVWAINPDKDHLSDLVQRMRRFSSDILDASEIDHRFEVDDRQREVALGAEVRREVYLIFKECINNLVKHAEASKAGVTVKIENRSLVIEVSDNGRGFVEPSDTEDLGFGGNGLANMRRRAERLGGVLSVRSEIGNGTTIEIKVPVKEKRSANPTT